MTTGHVMFYIGIGLLVFTIVLGIAFWLKKPQYIPGNAAYDQRADKNTRKLRSGYPTDRLTIRRESGQPVATGTAVLSESTARLEMERTDTLPGTEVLPSTELLQEQQTERLDDVTLPIDVATLPLETNDGSGLPYSRTAVLDRETEVLDEGSQSSDTERL